MRLHVRGIDQEKHISACDRTRFPELTSAMFITQLMRVYIYGCHHPRKSMANKVSGTVMQGISIPEYTIHGYIPTGAVKVPAEA